MEELLKMINEAYNKSKKIDNKINKEIEKNFRSAEELGLQSGDMVIFKDGDVHYIIDFAHCRVNYKNIAEVKRPIDWETVEIRKPKRIRRKGAK